MDILHTYYNSTLVTWPPMDMLVPVVIEWPPIQGETRWKEKFHLYAMMAINHLMDGIKMQPECITPTLWQNVQTLVRATKYHLKGVPWVKASQLYVCIEPGFFAICSLYNIYQSRPTNTLRAYWMDGQWLNVCLFRVFQVSSLFAFTSKYCFRLIQDSNNENINIKSLCTMTTCISMMSFFYFTTYWVNFITMIEWQQSESLKEFDEISWLALSKSL